MIMMMVMMMMMMIIIIIVICGTNSRLNNFYPKAFQQQVTCKTLPSFGGEVK
jgi:hypothetical protein